MIEAKEKGLKVSGFQTSALEQKQRELQELERKANQN